MTERIIPIADGRVGPVPEIPRLALPPSGRLIDRRGRRLHDLRISVTDRCNFRCRYCMPKEVFDSHYDFLPHQALLSFEEITRVARIAIAHGVEKLRLTGGEPLLRRHIEHLVEMLAQLRTPSGQPVDLTLTTNGALLARKARALVDAGLRRVTVSLDALDDTVFRAMNDVDFPVSEVLAGIEAAQTAGLAPVKVNMVVKRGLNDAQVVAMARHFRNSGCVLRFIEFMDVGTSNGWRLDDVVPSDEIVRTIDAVHPIEPVGANYPGEVAERWRYRDGAGEIGVISSVTHAFCHDCTRARLSTDGKLYLCLFAGRGHDLRALLRGDYDDAQISAALGQLWQQRNDRYSELRGAATAELRKVEMSYIGG